MGECLTKPGNTQTRGYYSVLKRNELSSSGETGRNLNGVSLSERGQREGLCTAGFRLCDNPEKAERRRQSKGHGGGGGGGTALAEGGDGGEQAGSTEGV